MPFYSPACALRTHSKNLKPAHIRNTVARFAVILFFLFSTPEHARPNTSFLSLEDDPNTPWHINADEINYDESSQQYIAQGNVTITKMDKTLTADFVRFNQQTMKVSAVGHVIMTAGSDVLTGSRMEMDLKTETGTIYNGTIFIEANHFYISGEKINKVGPDTYTAEKGCVTTCDGDRPAWKITGKNLKATIEGYGFVKHAALWTKYVPVLYFPWMAFPVKIKRQTGLLTPQFGYSDRKWEEYNQPVYLVIDESRDATIYWHHMGRRGEKLGLEYRYVLDEKSKGTLMYDYLDDKKTDNGDPSDRDWAYHDDNVTRPNSDRYWFRMKHDQPLPLGLSSALDIDFVSDQDYLKEFQYGYTGFEDTYKYFNKTFSREIDPFDESTRLNRFNVRRTWPRYNFNADLRWNDNVVLRRQSDTNPTLQKLPVVEFSASKQQIRKSRFYFDLDSEYTHFYREDGQRGHRVDAYPRVYLPYKFKYYFTIEPSMGFRETIYHFDKLEYTGPTGEKNLSRQMFDVKIDTSSEIYGIYKGIGKNIDKIKHIVRPRIVYSYIPNVDQKKYPTFDSIDRIAKQNLITYSLTNTFTSKSFKQKERNGEQGDTEKGSDEQDNAEDSRQRDYTYRQVCRFKLEQSYDINEAKEDNPAKRADKNQKKPFSAIFGEIDINPANYFSIHADATRSPYESFYQSHNVAVGIWDKRKDKLFVERRYRHKASDSIYYDLNVVITDKLTAYTQYERNLLDGIDIKTSFGLLYKTQCWSLETSYIDEANDRRYLFVISLEGISKFGHSLKGRSIENPYSGGY